MSNYRRMARMFQALSNPHRLRIFERLLSCCPPGRKGKVPAKGEEIPHCVGDLGKGLGIAPSTLSHHLKELVDAGLVSTNKRGRYVECCVNKKALDALGRTLAINIQEKGCR